MPKSSFHYDSPCAVCVIQRFEQEVHNATGDDACRCYQQVTCKCVTIRNLSTANELVDTAIAAALQEKKPVLIQVHGLTQLP